MVDFAAVVDSRRLARLRVPLGWALGVAALVFARPTPALLALGAALAFAGEALRLWASGHLEKNRKLTTTGPYAWTRNPLYLGSLVVGVGFSVAAGRVALVVLLVILFGAVYIPVMKREALRLRESFGADYTLYASRVPLFLPRPPGDSERISAVFAWDRVLENREHVTVLGLLAVVSVLGVKLVAGF